MVGEMQVKRLSVALGAEIRGVSLAEAGPEERFQFERTGYFCVDAVDSTPGAPVFNRSVTLRDTWAKKSRGS